MIAPAARFENKRKPYVRLDVRITEDLLNRLATFGNAQGLSFSETCRWVLEQGLDHSRCKR
jgi:hypothetical protein